MSSLSSIPLLEGRNGYTQVLNDYCFLRFFFYISLFSDIYFIHILSKNWDAMKWWDTTFMYEISNIFGLVWPEKLKRYYQELAK